MQALTPLTLGISSVKASLLGAWWGFGHCIGQLILGLLMLCLKVRHASPRRNLSCHALSSLGDKKHPHASAFVIGKAHMV